MDLSFLYLDNHPFATASACHRLFWSGGRQKALQAIIYGIEGRQGLMVLLGERGMGKTTLLHDYLAQRVQQTIRVISYSGVDCTFAALLEHVCQPYDVPVNPNELEITLRQLRAVLIREHEYGRKVVLILDDAEHLSMPTLEHLLVLSEMEDGAGKLLQIILLAPPAFEQELQRSASEPLKQGIAIRATLRPLTAEDRELPGHGAACYAPQWVALRAH